MSSSTFRFLAVVLTLGSAPVFVTPDLAAFNAAFRRVYASSSAFRFLAVILTLGCAPVFATPDLTAFNAAQARFQQARAGDKSATDTAVEHFERLLAAEPGSPLLHAYHGSAVSLKARDSLLPWRKLRFADEGLAEIDRALGSLTPAHDTEKFRGVPVSAETRLVAASTFIGMPGSFHRADAGRRLLGQVMAAPGFDSLPEGFRAAVWMQAADGAHKAEQKAEEIGFLKHVAALQVPQATAARARLKELGQ